MEEKKNALQFAISNGSSRPMQADLMQRNDTETQTQKFGDLLAPAYHKAILGNKT